MRKRVSVVFQDTFLFSGSIRFNICIGNPEASDKEVRLAARRAGIADYIESLPDSYETKVGCRGTRLSGGQKQRIAIARAILSNPDILLLDEITSKLDFDTEKGIMDVIFGEQFKGKTIIAVSHKPTVLKYFDRFLYVDSNGLTEITENEAMNVL